MPRRNRPRSPGRADTSAPRLGAGLGWSRTEAGPDGDWLVRTIPAAQATKLYRCPGCDHEIRPGVSHVVAWPADEHGSVEERRHWHTGCWRSGYGRRRW
ncbi:hypothetical protein FHX42_002569 [Saccharopolyspora lacisalsi]|uniref:ATP/GTP-binding protein n=1 Tax=Halosaccharopolyspora lacisalsi TaxID=1000566 RepID=A0A839E2R5_9PSEU|nr:hypothetical protein [Halosaccharopolyspora lacisalsi]MBA8825218.1 hypothetical protein [Halosaccharopolyspora lacisalsi]